VSSDSIGPANEGTPARKLSEIGLLCGICGPVSGILLPILITLSLGDPLLQVIGFVPAALIVAGFVLSIVAKARGAQGPIVWTAIGWNTLMIGLYGMLIVSLLLNPVSPS
jgi:hypothetical protein